MKVSLTITNGPKKNTVLQFDTHTTCIIGRGDDCAVQLPSCPEYKGVSKIHCIIIISPPEVMVRDFSSRNGTFVNDIRLLSSEKEAENTHELQHGDIIRIGLALLQLKITESGNLDTLSAISTLSHLSNPDKVKKLLAMAESGEKNLTFFKNYKYVKELKSSIRGHDYLAVNKKTGDMISLRLIAPAKIITGQTLENCKQALENAQALRHENITKTWAYTYQDGVFLIASEYCKGGSLESMLLRRGGKIAFDEAKALILQLLSGLKYAHNMVLPYPVKMGKGKGMVHHFLQPGSLFLTSPSFNDNQIKITGYGLNKIFSLYGLTGESLTQSQDDLAPYVPRQRVVEFRYMEADADIWSVAAIFYLMLTGKTPRDFQKQGSLWQSVLLSEPVPIRERDASIPTHIASVIDQALREKPVLVFKSATQFMHLIKNVKYTT